MFSWSRGIDDMHTDLLRSPLDIQVKWWPEVTEVKIWTWAFGVNAFPCVSTRKTRWLSNCCSNDLRSQFIHEKPYGDLMSLIWPQRSTADLRSWKLIQSALAGHDQHARFREPLSSIWGQTAAPPPPPRKKTRYRRWGQAACPACTRVSIKEHVSIWNTRYP